jgi:hypothetical protein
MAHIKDRKKIPSGKRFSSSKINLKDLKGIELVYNTETLIEGEFLASIPAGLRETMNAG